MFTSPERKPSVSNWFSSLRRQPKPKKPISNNAKRLQKSCVDLSTVVTSTVPSTNTLSIDNNSSGSSSSSTLINEQSPTIMPPSIGAINGIGGVSSSSSSSGYNGSSKMINFDKVTIMATSPTKISKTNTIEIDQIKKISSTSSSTATSPTSTAKATSEFKITTTTKVTSTTVVTKQIHRVGLVFNDNGELISNLESFRNFANNLNSKLLSITSPSTLTTPSTSDNNNCDSSGNSLLLEGDDIEYIDDTTTTTATTVPAPSTSQSDIRHKDTIKSTIATVGKQQSSSSCVTCNNSSNSSSNNKMKSKTDTNSRMKKQIKDELCEVVAEMEALDSQEDCKHSNKDKQMSIGRKKFNMDPKKGIEYLCENHLLRMDAQDIAHFLYKGEGLNKTAIGDYLGEKNDFNEQVLKAFVELHDFTNLILVQALRQFLWSFRLPGEAQKIDRMMECFAQRYCQLNPDIFTNTDTCYVLSFAIIMLNTSLHNPSVKDKPALEQFISMNRGINNGGDLPRELLESLYESIRTEPFKIPQDDGNDLMHTFFNPDKEGWLWKQGGRYKSWKRRWFILNDNCLYYFEYTTDKEPRGIIPLENISVREIQDRNKPHCFELYACGGADIIKACKTDSEGKVVEGKHTVYRMSAATEEDKLEWIKCLTQSISHNPFYDILVQRKKKALAKS